MSMLIPIISIPIPVLIPFAFSFPTHPSISLTITILEQMDVNCAEVGMCVEVGEEEQTEEGKDKEEEAGVCDSVVTDGLSCADR
jgi:hypothetical protein